MDINHYDENMVFPQDTQEQHIKHLRRGLIISLLNKNQTDSLLAGTRC